MLTGIFFYYQEGERLRDFPEALDGILEKENVFLYDAFYISKPKSDFELEPVPEELLYKVHSKRMVDTIKASKDYLGALYSAAGTLSAAVKIISGEIDNAFIFTGYGDHHAGYDSFGGGCYFNGAAIAISELEDKFKVNRFAVIDTDAHHGDGTWDLFQDKSNVLNICFCSSSLKEKNRNINIKVPYRVNDEEYISLARESFDNLIYEFQPEIIFWNWGYDGTIGEYGDMGLTPDLHLQLAREIKNVAEDVCSGRLIVILCGGSRRDLAFQLIPQIIHILSE